MDVRLIVDSGSLKGRETNLARGVYLVGRSKMCQIRPKNRYVSRKHCALIHRKRELLLQDLGSTSGTFVNGKKIQVEVALKLNDGDRIRVGNSWFRIAIVGQPEAPTLPAMPRTTADGESSSYQKDSDQQDKDPQDRPGDSQVIGATNDEPNGDPHGEELRDIEDVLSILDEENNEPDSDSPSSIIAGGNVMFLPTANDEVDLTDQEDSDGNVEFAAPKSNDSLDVSQQVPSYALRQDWDVKGVYNWVSAKEAEATEKRDQAKRELKERIEARNAEKNEVQKKNDHGAALSPKPPAVKLPKEKSPVSTRFGAWEAWFESDFGKPAALIVCGAVIFAWLLWNIWQLWSFKG